MHFFSSRKPLWRLKDAAIRKTNTFYMPSIQHTEEPRTSPPGSGGPDTCLDVPLAGVCRSALSREQSRLVLSKLEQHFEFGRNEDRTDLDCELLC